MHSVLICLSYLRSPNWELIYEPWLAFCINAGENGTTGNCSCMEAADTHHAVFPWDRNPATQGLSVQVLCGPWPLRQTDWKTNSVFHCLTANKALYIGEQFLKFFIRKVSISTLCMLFYWYNGLCAARILSSVPVHFLKYCACSGISCSMRKQPSIQWTKVGWGTSIRLSL